MTERARYAHIIFGMFVNKGQRGIAQCQNIYTNIQVHTKRSLYLELLDHKLVVKLTMCITYY